jgi:hypothetical protein
MKLEVFDKKTRFESDVYIGDYTEYAKTHADCGYNGVAMKNMPIPYIASLHIHNPVHIPMLGANFEESPDVFRQGDGTTVPNCECMLVSDKSSWKGWLLLAELKYCGGSQMAMQRNLEKAFKQLESTYTHLRDVKHVFVQGEFRCVWVVSLPEHNALVPFSSFMSGPETRLDFKDKYGVDVFTDNNLKVVSHEYVVAIGD